MSAINNKTIYTKYEDYYYLYDNLHSFRQQAIISNQERRKRVENQIKSRNEVIIVGKIVTRQRKVKCNGQEAIKIGVAMKNYKDSGAGPNIAYVYVYDDGKIYDSLKRRQNVSIKGHIECNYSQKIIVDEIRLIKELDFK